MCSQHAYWLYFAVKGEAVGNECQILKLLRIDQRAGALEQDDYSELTRVDLDVSNEIIINDASKHGKLPHKIYDYIHLH